MFSIINNRANDKKMENNYEPNENGFVKLFFNLGKKDNIMAKDVIGSISSNTAVSGRDIGKINILENFSFVEVPVNYVEEVLSEMDGNTIKGKQVNVELANS